VSGPNTVSSKVSSPLTVRRRFQARFNNPLDPWLAEQ
jgi:hypothetical protein